MQVTTVRLSKKLLSTLPANVAQTLSDLALCYNVASVKIVTEVDNIYVDEGCQYHGFSGHVTANFTAASESTLGGAGLSYAIGSLIKLPSNSLVVEKGYFMGKNTLTVYQFA